jgi:hypothetical protein
VLLLWLALHAGLLRQQGAVVHLVEFFTLCLSMHSGQSVMAHIGVVCLYIRQVGVGTPQNKNSLCRLWWPDLHSVLCSAGVCKHTFTGVNTTLVQDAASAGQCHLTELSGSREETCCPPAVV